MKIYPEAGSRPDIDLSGVVFEDGYVIPRESDSIASGYQKGFAVDPDITRRWLRDPREGHAIAEEFVRHYYRSIGYGDAVEIEFTRPHHDDLCGVVVYGRHVGDTGMFSHNVWPAQGRVCISDNR